MKEIDIAELAIDRLSELVGLQIRDADIQPEDPRLRPDAVVRAGPYTIVMEVKRSGSPVNVSTAIRQLKAYTSELKGDIIALVAVPYMGATGKDMCANSEVAWLDLSGNARIFHKGLRINVDGKPNLYKQPGRPSSPFAPKSSRIARWLLIHPESYFTQRELSHYTGMDEGYTSKVVKKLEEIGLIDRNQDGAVRCSDPDLLFKGWRNDYEFGKHDVLRGHIAARSGEALLERAVSQLEFCKVPCAATGLAAAWQYDRYVSFRLVTLYLEKWPTSDVQAKIGFRPEESGSNVWLVIPNDEGVFQEARVEQGIRCVHPVQVYIDLDSQPERSKEAAARLCQSHLPWINDE